MPVPSIQKSVSPVGIGTKNINLPGSIVILLLVKSKVVISSPASNTTSLSINLEQLLAKLILILFSSVYVGPCQICILMLNLFSVIVLDVSSFNSYN